MIWPERSTILATHTAELSAEFGHRVRRCVSEFGPRLTGLTLDPSFKSRDHYVTHAGGHFRTTSPGSSVAGKGAHLLIGDDLVKDAQKAASPSARRALMNWFTSEALTRLEPGGKVLLVMSRRHPDDLSGALMALNEELPARDQWHTVRFQAIGDDGSALWPERYPLSKLEDIRRGYELLQQSHFWASLYQQDPTADSSMLEWPEQLFEATLTGPERWMPHGSRPVKRLLVVDPSKGRSDKVGDFCAIVDLTFTSDRQHWVTPRLERLMNVVIEDTIVEQCVSNRYDVVVIESNGPGTELAGNVAVKARQRGIQIPLYKFNQVVNKQVRIKQWLGPILRDNLLRVDARAQGAKLLMQQLKEFPTSEHDDGPDALATAKHVLDLLLQGKVKL